LRWAQRGIASLTDVDFTEIARAESPRGEVVLRQRRVRNGPAVLELRANGIFVMDTAETSTEVALAAEALAAIADPRDVVIGGLGLGFTLEAVLADPRVEHVTVVEIEEALIGWLRDGTVPHGQALLADRRVKMVNADLAMAVVEARSSYDLLLLDVDNGPGYLVHDANGSLYEPEFLRRCRAILNPGGLVAIWSAAEAPELAATMRAVFDHVEQRALPVSLQGREVTYWLYLAGEQRPVTPPTAPGSR
jgi:spermidine synthase